jgi:hypothetical protein
MRLTTLAAFLAALSSAAAAAPMSTADYFPLVDGTRYEYVFTSGPHASATAVMHADQAWGGTG